MGLGVDGHDAPLPAAAVALLRHERRPPPWLAREVGELGIEALRALKARLDPAGIMNPGKLIDAGGDRPA